MSTTSIKNPAQPISAPLVDPGGQIHSPASLLDSFRASNLQPSQHPALAGMSPSGFAEAGRLAGKPVRPLR
jgi:hypothetical protein